MVVDSPQPPLSFVILEHVFLSTHFDDDGDEKFDDTHAGVSILVENILIIDEQNDGTCHFDDDEKGGFDDKHMGLSVLIWRLIVINEQNCDETSR